MKKLIFIISLALCLLSSCSQSPRKLVILHVNDTHSHLDPLRDGRGGVIERASIIDSIRASRGHKNVLLLHAGDFSQGSSYFPILNGDLEIDLINAMGYDCITLGNHEFDNGVEELGRRLSNLHCPVVCANYDFSPFEAGKYVTPYTIVRKAGINIGIIGLLTDVSKVVDRNTADRLPRLDDNIGIVNKWSDYLRNDAHCDMVILLTHIGYEQDIELCAGLHGVDVIVGGHSHTLLDELTITQDADDKDVTIVTDGSWGLEVAELSL